jgi:uncharacterized membrane protein
MTDLLLLVVYGVILVCAIRLFVERSDYRRWFYLAYGFAFACLMVSIWPGLEGSAGLGFVLLISTTGLKVLTDILFDRQEQHGLNLKTGKLIKH